MKTKRLFSKTVLLFMIGCFSFHLHAQVLGDKDNPILISTAEELSMINSALDKHYKLVNDIDLSDFLKGKENGWEQVPHATFTGSLDGDDILSPDSERKAPECSE